jgi:hypothetical protein
LRTILNTAPPYSSGRERSSSIGKGTVVRPILSFGTEYL